MRLTQSIAKECFTYEPETGILRWKVRPREHFTTKHGANVFNARYAGKPVGVVNKYNGYREMRVFGKSYKVHRIVWLLVIGEMPKELDHINGARSDNRICNLRSVDRATNSKNAAISSRNTSGVVGVSWHKAASKWQSYISAQGKRIALGLFAEKTDAVAARKDAETKYGYHKNHGRSAK